MCRFRGILLFALMVFSVPVQAATEAESLSRRAWSALSNLLNDEDFSELRRLIPTAEGVLIVPDFYKASMFVGGGGGKGVLVVRGEDRAWSPPAFYTLAEASLGLQVGAKESELVLLVMNRAGVSDLLEDQITLGAEAGLSVGEIGKTVEWSTSAEADADILAVASSEGLFGGASLEGSWLAPDLDLNESLYGPGATPRAILLQYYFPPAPDDQLLKLLAQVDQQAETVADQAARNIKP